MTLAPLTEVPTAAGTEGIADYMYTRADPSATRALSIKTDYLRTDVDVLHDDVHRLHERTREQDLNERTLAKSRKDVPALLTELANERGMAWSDIADLARVSVSAVRKWRKGGDASAESRGRLAAIASLLDVLEEKALVQDPAQWMEMELPLGAGYFVRPLDLYREGHSAPLLDIAEQRMSPEKVLDDIDPGWRDARRTSFDVRVDTDGERTIFFRND